MSETPCKSLLFTVLLCFYSVNALQAQEGVVSVNQDREIDALLNLKREINRDESNYTLQVYNGNRVDAEKAQLEFIISFSDWTTSMKYETPNYKIWVGNFKTRLQADRALLKVKKKFRNAFIFKPKKGKRNL